MNSKHLWDGGIAALLVITSTVGYAIIMQWMVVSLSLLSLLFASCGSETVEDGTMTKRGFHVWEGLSLLAVGVSFFIVANNVFLMRIGEKHCPHCAVATPLILGLSSGYLCLYLGLVLLGVKRYIKPKKKQSNLAQTSSISLRRMKVDI